MTINDVLQKLMDIGKFNMKQLTIIKQGLIEGVDVAIYADPKFSSEQMEVIRKGLSKKLNVDLYADPSLYWTEMQEIYDSLLKNRKDPAKALKETFLNKTEDTEVPEEILEKINIF